MGVGLAPDPHHMQIGYEICDSYSVAFIARSQVGTIYDGRRVPVRREGGFTMNEPSRERGHKVLRKRIR